jgi:hypothetical protein
VYAIIEIPAPPLAVVPVVVPDAVLPAVPTANQKIISFICIPNLKGTYSSYLECNKTVKQIDNVLDDEEQMKIKVIDDMMKEIRINTKYSTNLDNLYIRELKELYSKNHKINKKLVEFDNFKIEVKNLPIFKDFFPITCYFNEKLKDKFDRITIPGDGNCLFTCLQLGIEQWKRRTPSEVRNEICNNLKDIIKKLIEIRNLSITPTLDGESPGPSVIIIEVWIAEILKHSVDKITDQIIENYITRMRNEQEFGGLLEIITAIHLTRFNIIIYQMDGNLNNNFEDIKNEIKFGDNDDEFSTFTDDSAVYLYHCNSTGIMAEAEHYELLVKKSQPSITYKYMKYKMKYLTLKNNMHYNKYL